MTLRLLRPADVSAETLERMNYLLHELSPRRALLTPQSLLGVLESPTQVFVVLEEGVIVGTASVVVAHQIVGTRAWMEDVVVDPVFRGRGIARRLTEAAIDWARQAECISIDLTSKGSRQSAWQLYADLGFVMRETSVYRLELAPKPT